MSVSYVVKLAVAITLSVTVTVIAITVSVTVAQTLTTYLLSKLNLPVSPSNPPPSGTPITGGTCCQFNVYVSNQSPSVITTRGGPDYGRRNDPTYKQPKPRKLQVHYEPEYPPSTYYPRRRQPKRRAAPAPCPCWDW